MIRNAIPEGFFKSGKSKQVYDVLYSLTRGDIVPKRKVQIQRSRLMKLAGVGSRVTIDSILSSFAASGLIKIDFRYGQHAGNEIEVFIYEEIIHRGAGAPTGTSTPSQTSTPSSSSSPQKVDRLGGLENSLPSTGAEVANIGPPATPKTFFKDFLNPDDERPLREALDRFATIAREATGRELTPADCAGLGDILHIVLDETTAATSRTGSISCFGKFAAEHIRRRLRAKARTERKADVFHPGRSESPEGPEPILDEGALAPKPLGERRETELGWLGEIVANQGIDYTEKTYAALYTTDDWEWLKGKLLQERTA